MEEQQQSVQESRWDRFMRCVSNTLDKRNNYSSVAWVLLFIGEFFAFLWIRGFNYILGEWTVYGTVVAGLLILLLWRVGQRRHHDFKVRSVILTRLLANTIVPKRIGTIYLVLFVIHVGWLTNAVMSLFVGSELCKVGYTVLVCIVGTVILTVFFPDSGIKDGGHTKSVVISGISKMFPSSEYDSFNLKPFVRIFQKVSADAIWVIVSDAFVKDGYVSPSVFVTEEEKRKNSLKFRSFKTESIVNVKKGGKSVSSKGFVRKLGRVQTKTYSLEEIKQDLGQVIKNFACLEFYDDAKALATIKKCKIEFSDFVADYNNYQDSFMEINALAQSLDQPDTKLYFNLTPGTVTMSSVMTLIAVDGDRRLYYYSQDTNLSEEMKMKEVNKNLIPLENLLSQALESVTKRH